MTLPNTTGWFRRLLLPGLVFQSVVIAGGYGTGRELAEFFLGYGPRLGLLSMVLISTTIWSLVCALSFEFARKVGARDYRAFFKRTRNAAALAELLFDSWTKQGQDISSDPDTLRSFVYLVDRLAEQGEPLALHIQKQLQGLE